ncbi:MAG: 3-isopropylmalate dehydratase small subunit [Candidatus Bathyarchaeota archaeon]|nr:3-isopropylmalate dehydratase small subunit [Candidatus Bathyarchaeota archaeon]
MSRLIEGRVWKLWDDINTDLIIPGKYKLRITSLDELSRHAMEGVDPQFIGKFGRGDLIVAGRNFGCGSSREQAPLVLKHIGVSAIVARSFARIFYRNSINVGLPVVECKDVDKMSDQDLLRVDLEAGMAKNLTKEDTYRFKSFPTELWQILSEGGLVQYVKKHGTLPWQT